MIGETSHDPYAGWNDSLRGDFLWTNVNFGEAVTDPMTPLAWSVLEFTLEDWAFLPGYSTTGNIGGRPYINISIFASLWLALGRSHQDLTEMMEGTLYMHLPEGMEIPRISLSRRDVLSGLAKSVRIQMRYWRGIRALPTYLATNAEWCQRMRDRIRAEGSGPGLAALWRGEIAPHVKGAVWTVLGTATRSSDYTMALRRDLAALAGPEDANRLIANVSEEDVLLASLGPAVGLARVARGELSRRQYLALFGHRGPHEFEISLPRPAEDPDWLDRQLAQVCGPGADAQALLARQQEAFEATWQRFEARHPGEAGSMRRRIATSAQHARHREGARSEYVRDRWLVRCVALRAGELTGLGEDVFYLTLDEMLALLSGDRQGVDHVPARQETYQRYLALPPYPPIIRGRFEPFQWAADPQRRTDIYDGRATPAASAIGVDVTIAEGKGGPEVVTGAPGSAGRVEGIVRRLDQAEEGDQLQAGEVLVTMMTDIAWTPLFPRAAAVVTDVGAPLSHAAIVARELGIPAVVGCGDATMRLHTGDRVRVDGTKGTVTVLGRSSQGMVLDR
jgi:pyruvate,water dikinase